MSLDGYFFDANGDMSGAHNFDPEWTAFAAKNPWSSGVELLFGRITYEVMASDWPTQAAREADPAVAEGMNRLPEVVFSRTPDKVSWSNTRRVKGGLVEEVRRMKQAPGSDLVILGSGTLVSPLAREGLMDRFQSHVAAQQVHALEPARASRGAVHAPGRPGGRPVLLRPPSGYLCVDTGLGHGSRGVSNPPGHNPPSEEGTP